MTISAYAQTDTNNCVRQIKCAHLNKIATEVKRMEFQMSDQRILIDTLKADNAVYERENYALRKEITWHQATIKKQDSAALVWKALADSKDARIQAMTPSIWSSPALWFSLGSIIATLVCITIIH